MIAAVVALLRLLVIHGAQGDVIVWFDSQPVPMKLERAQTGHAQGMYWERAPGAVTPAKGGV